MDALLVIIVVAVLAAAGVAWGVARRRRVSVSTPAAAPPGPSVRSVVLDVGAVDPDAPATERMVTDAARSTLARFPGIEQVRVIDRGGSLLGTRRRHPAPLPGPPPSLPPVAPTHHAHVPTPVRTSDTAPPTLGEPPDRPPRPLADRFDLPGAVLDRIVDPDDAIAILEAILTASGRPVERIPGGLLSRDRFFSVIGSPVGPPALPRVLSEVYLRFVESGASLGVVISFDYLDRDDVRRRELLDPRLQHIGRESIQRMADAVALGADPVPFATRDPFSLASP